MHFMQFRIEFKHGNLGRYTMTSLNRSITSARINSSQRKVIPLHSQVNNCYWKVRLIIYRLQLETDALSSFRNNLLSLQTGFPFFSETF